MNSWGLSSNNYFSEDIVSKMKGLTKIDFSDTINYRHRSDLCMGIKSLLLSAVTCNIEKLDVSNNFLDLDGGRAFKEFLEQNKSLKTLMVNNC